MGSAQKVHRRMVDAQTILAEAIRAHPELKGFEAACNTEALLSASAQQLLQRGGEVLGNLAAVQAIYRPLRAGELRQALCRRVHRGLGKSIFLKADPRIAMLLDRMSKSSGL
eukprot:5829161-Pyramimonas_sp.AAC.1